MSHRTHLAALGRAELTLLLRSKANLFSVLIIPVMLVGTMKVVMAQFDLAAAGLSVGPVMISTAAGIVLLMALYTPLTSTYVMRREQLLLKRLRSGEVADLTILLGSALPVVAVVPFQFALISTAITLIADEGGPRSPQLAVVGILLGAVLVTALAALTTVLARTAESAQVAVLPGMFLLPLTSGTYIPLEVYPHVLQEVFRFFPLTPVTDLVRAGWTGSMTAAQAAVRVMTLLVWITLVAFAARRWFRWEPRT
ncbi:ABC transporter permease [Streptomyces fuscichromogenes]|uniref:Transport permease protein n=1 Tax=Streptomyces fuscichromogenes TaxID=1324013 RepID=A0A918CT21_9ACTN|nr:ABC transporter permease [Streptomyces fuscichromogenes]GGN19622.1 transport permease protein [Streptomyces fuscichromogenes]